MAHLELVRATAEPPEKTRLSTQSTAKAAEQSDIQLSVSHDLAEVEAIWRALEATGDLTVFQTFDWLSTWQQHIGERTGVTPAIVVGGPPHAPQFILPLATAKFGPLRQLTFLGHDLCDYNGAILSVDFPRTIGSRFPEVWKRIVAMLQRDARHRHDLVSLDKMLEATGTQANPFMALPSELHPSGAYATELGPDWDAYYAAKRSNSTRRRDRTKRRHLADQGPVELMTAIEPADVAANLAKLIGQKQQSFARMGVTNLFDRPGYRDFYEAIAAGDRSRVHVCRLQVGDLAAATNMGLRFRDRYYYILASYDGGPISKHGPGVILLHDLMHYALEQDVKVFDFTVGDEAYKREWCEIELKLYDHVSSSSLAGALAVSALDAARRAKRAIKQSPWLWPIAQRVRAKLRGQKPKAPEPVE